jgi:hypothetical protein
MTRRRRRQTQQPIELESLPPQAADQPNPSEPPRATTASTTGGLSDSGATDHLDDDCHDVGFDHCDAALLALLFGGLQLVFGFGEFDVYNVDLVVVSGGLLSSMSPDDGSWCFCGNVQAVKSIRGLYLSIVKEEEEGDTYLRGRRTQCIDFF